MKSLSPTIIARADHCISRSMISPHALKALYRLRDHGFDARLVGGCVRDLLLGREPKDFDLVTDATPSQIKRLFRNCRLVGRRFRLAHLHYGDEIIEVATFRAVTNGEEEELEDAPAEGRQPRLLKSADGVVLRDNVFGTPSEDAWRRDFSINSLSYSIADFSVLDYVGGVQDLRQGVIRTIGDPRERFTEDPVRMIRAVRFAAILGFSPDAETSSALHELAPTIVRAAPARLYEEMLKLFLCGAAERVYAGLRQSGLYAALFPHHHAWLEAGDTLAHTWHGQALHELDQRIQAGDKVSPVQFIALYFGGYLEALAAAGAAAGVPPVSAIDAAVAQFMEEMLPRLHVQRRIALQVREILLAQRRFALMPGKKAPQFVARPVFPLALDYLRFTAEVRQEGRAVVQWWQNFSADIVTEPPEAVPAADRPRRRSRRRRRRSRPTAD
jgi:poly(A) polymerase